MLSRVCAEQLRQWHRYLGPLLSIVKYRSHPLVLPNLCSCMDVSSGVLWESCGNYGPERESSHHKRLEETMATARGNLEETQN